MNIRDTITTLIMLLALAGMSVLLFNIPVGIETKKFGAIVFGAILVFGIINIGFVVLDRLQNRQ